MAISLSKKKIQTESLTNQLQGKECVVFVEFTKFKVKDTNQFRRALQDAGVSYVVIKKTLAKRAMDTMSYNGEHPELAGEIGLAFSQDPIGAAREVYNFSKLHKDNVKIVGGVYEREYIGAGAMMAIATIPSREMLYTQIVSLLMSPIQGFATAVSEIAKKQS